MYKSQFKKTDPYDWFCAPRSHIFDRDLVRKILIDNTPRLFSLLVGQEDTHSWGFLFSESLESRDSCPSSLRISLTSCMRQRVKSSKEIFPRSSAPSCPMISATESSMFSCRQTISRSFLTKRQRCLRFKTEVKHAMRSYFRPCTVIPNCIWTV